VSRESIQEIVCCLGQPVAGNPTQFVMEQAFADAGLDWRYLTLEVGPADLADALRGVRGMGFRGCNLTIPHKVAATAHLDRLGESAALMGAVNCVHRVGTELVGENTDGKGFLESLRQVADPAGQAVVLLGAGGAARAIGVELALAGVRQITVVNRSVGRGEELSRLLTHKVHVPASFVLWEGNFRVPADAELVINATSIGLGDPGARLPVDIDTILPDMVAADVVFNPAETQWLRAARSRGCRTLDGLGMLVNQAAIAFQIWTGTEPDRELMRESLEEFLAI
jgi:shikimate dehydrogenase